MKILVCLKQILDPEVSPRDFELDRTKLRAAQGSANLVTNIFCENALETALQLKDSVGAEVTAVSFGPAEAEDVLRKALAMRVDHAVLVRNSKIDQFGSAVSSSVLAAAIRKLGDFDVIMLGREAGDWGEGQTAGLVAEELGLPFVAFVDTVEPVDSGTKVYRQTEIGREEIATQLPLVVSVTNNAANVPRIPKTGDIMKAHRQELTSWSLEDVGLSEDSIRQSAAGTEIVDLFIPERDTICEFISGDSIDDRLQNFAQRVVDVVRRV